MDLIAKKYRILKTLGQGAMGEVYLVMGPRGTGGQGLTLDNFFLALARWFSYIPR